MLLCTLNSIDERLPLSFTMDSAKTLPLFDRVFNYLGEIRGLVNAFKYVVACCAYLSYYYWNFEGDIS